MIDARSQAARVKRASIAGAWLGAISLGLLGSLAACSLILSPSSLDTQYGRDGGGGSSSTGHGGHAGAVSTGSGSGTGGATCSGGVGGGDAGELDASDGGCGCVYGCDDAGQCNAGSVEPGAPTPNGIACGSTWTYAVGAPNIDSNLAGQVLQYDRSGRVCSCIDTSDPAYQDPAKDVAVGTKQMVWRTLGADGGSRFWTLPNADCCCGLRPARLVVAPTIATSTIDFGTGLATDDTSLYWLDQGAVKKAPLQVSDAGSGAIIAPAPDGGGSNLDGLALGAGVMLFNQAYQSTVQAVNLVDGGVRSWPSGGENRGIQTNGSLAVWAVLHISTPSPGQGAIYGVSIVNPSDEPAPLNAAFSQPSGLAIDGQYVYVSDSDLGTISRISIASHQVDVLSTGHYLPTNVCNDDRFLYWLDYVKTGGLMRVEKVPR